MPISRKRSYTAPSMALRTIIAAITAGIASAPRPWTEVSPTELKRYTEMPPASSPLIAMMPRVDPAPR